ncbi:energy transducer TonB [Coraliomargarita sp. SDUM461003]|uniref:Energy transducer TonB n=1 Tax=Thalassobacterium maritimum TaxID=3041265 RepID=A0ABU1B229_9BACT|nr:energy transducer TonB [Coraliomargarita sp. SDUM461003]MDQ8209482.1 energy transducer TonB [Coraliomargarita sp. SDUM461003]
MTTRFQGAEFVRLKRESFVQEKARSLPQPPEPPKAPPPPPTMEVDVAEATTAPPPQMALPRINVPLRAAGGAGGFLGSGSTATATGTRDSEAVPTMIPQADYPRKAIMRNLEGSVKARITVGVDGSVIDVEILDSSDRMFELPARKALYKARFRPKTVNGEPVEATVVYDYEFTLAK